MKFNFFPRVSKIYDFLEFPRLLFFTKSRKAEEEEESNYKEFLSKEYWSFVREAEMRLKPFEKEIGVFYGKEYLNSYDFIDLVSKFNGILEYQDEKQYLDMLMTLSKEDINRSISFSLEKNDELTFEELEKTMDEFKYSIINKEDIISKIKQLPVDSAEKWNMFLMIEEPIKYMERYVSLMRDLLPIFEDIYAPYEKEINSYGNYLVGFLKERGEKGLEELTYSMLDHKILDDENNLLISLVFSYALTIKPLKPNNYIAWGLKMEEAFKGIKEFNENQINERVQIFKNLGDRTRYGVLKLIASGETSTKEIANILGVTSATVSYHINNFLTSKVIKIDKSNNRYGYIVDYEVLEKAIEGLKEDLKFQ